MNDNKKQWSERDIIERIKKYADGKVETALRPVRNTINTTTIESQKKYPESYPLVPVSFIGPYTDEFTSTDGLSGVFNKGATGAAMSASGGILTLSAASGSTAYVYAGRDGGAFLNGGDTWTAETILGDGDYVGYTSVGIGVAKQTFANNINWGATGKSCMSVDTYGGPQYRVNYTDSTYNYDVLAKAPSAADPLHLKISHTFDGTNHTFIYTYKFESDGSYTTLRTSVIADSYYAWDGELCDVGPLMCLSVVSPISYTFNSIEVNYVPTEISNNEYAFVPVSGFLEYVQDYIYIKDSKGDYYKIVPQTDFQVYNKTAGSTYKWSGSAWAEHLAEPAAHASSHENGGSDEISVEGLSGLLADGQTALQHAIDGALHSGQGDIVTHDISEFDAAGTATSEIATHSALDTGVHGVGTSDVAATGYVGALLAQLPAIFPTHTYAAATYLTLAGAAAYLPLAGGTMTGLLSVTGTTYGELSVGVDDTKRGIVRIYGTATGDASGGSIRIYNSADHDSIVNIWQLNSLNGNLDFSIYAGNTLLRLTEAGQAQIPGTQKLEFRDTGIYIQSIDDGHLDLTADVSVDINAPLAQTSGDIEITDPTKGIIMTDTQGTPHKWRLTLDGSGTPGLVWTDLGAA